MDERPEVYHEVTAWHEENPGWCPCCHQPSYEGMLCQAHKEMWNAIYTPELHDVLGAYMKLVQDEWEKHRVGPCAMCDARASLDDYLCGECRGLT